MFNDNSPSKTPQLPLFILEDTTGTVELFPSVWNAMENLTSYDVEIRHQALDKLLELILSFSPIVHICSSPD
jgi:hypothetical protein